jgi:spermidine synthase
MDKLSGRGSGFIYAALFLIAFSTMVLEVTLTRVLSVCTWYHLAFFAISSAMLGMTAGAVTVYLKPGHFSKANWQASCAWSSLLYALSVPVPLFLLCRMELPVEVSVFSPGIVKILFLTLACALPFYFSGIAISAVLTKAPLSINRLYAADLIGASIGCLFILAALELLNGPQLMLAAGLFGIPCAFAFAREPALHNNRKFIALAVFALLLALAMLGIRPEYVKGKKEDTANFLIEKWNSFSRVVVERGSERDAHFWAESPTGPNPKLFQHQMHIDGLAGTTMLQKRGEKDVQHLGFDVTNVGYFLRPKRNALIIGIGGGRDVQSALLFGKREVVGIDVNPVFINLLKKDLRDVTGLADDPRVRLVTDEARSYLSRTDEKFSFIQMSLIDTWAATGAGAFTLSENSLYTVEAWQIFFGRLAWDGIFSVARFYNPNVNIETGRVLSVAVAALLRSGITDYRSHIALISCKNVSVLLMSKEPFTRDDIARLAGVAETLKYQILVLPGKVPADPVLRQILSVQSEEDLKKIATDTPFDVSPSTDNRPYFFNMLRLSHIFFPVLHPGVVQGNLVATSTLIQLIVALALLCLLTIALPLIRSKQAPLKRLSWAGAFYFSLIGAGFMFIEIGLVQHLSVFLGHPTYALGILLFTIIASTGCGSLISEKLPLTVSPWKYVYPAATVLLILGTRAVSVHILYSMQASSMFLKIMASILILFPMGILLGFFFPTGMKFARLSSEKEMPWYWALNGIFGVLCSALAVFISIYAGISMNFFLAALCYLLILPVLDEFSETGNGGKNAVPPV